MSNEETKPGSEEITKIDETRRSLIRAGWIIPAVIAVQLPAATDAFASSVSADIGAHVDAGGVHVDAGAHVDV